jgi:hypothetical protein
MWKTLVGDGVNVRLGIEWGVPGGGRTPPPAFLSRILPGGSGPSLCGAGGGEHKEQAGARPPTAPKSLPSRP